MTFEVATAAQTRRRRDGVTMVAGYVAVVVTAVMRFGLDTGDADG